MTKLFIIFISLNILNVILSTIKSITMNKSTPIIASLVSAIYYILYTYVLIYTTCDLPMITKALIVGGCNLIGVFIVKIIEKKIQKDKLWKIEFTIKEHAKTIEQILIDKNIPYNYQINGKHTMFNAYCETQKQSKEVAEIVKQYNGKYFITENKSRLY